MPFLVKVTVDDHLFSIPATNAKEAFTTAVEWQVAKQHEDVLISDGGKNYSIAEFSAQMALSEIADTESKSASLNEDTKSRIGTVVALSSRKSRSVAVGVLFDGNKRPTRVQSSYVEIDDSEAKHE